ncbi:uncharacterized protein LOC110185994 [Drosophila serrata]|uniref:uncharacterized protein LOC110185994 n=1 Tax=Drosophila serrata TaxID=7274 RepID=UPI000A1D0805|nr:uncharacterized protein LOC110185994 [Drosophila serrata]
MAMPSIFIFLSLCVIISQEASVSYGPFENGNPVTFMGFNNNLGTYIEYKGQARIDLGQHSWRVAYDIEVYYISQELFLNGFKAINKYVILPEWRELAADSNTNTLLDTFHQLSTINDKMTTQLYINLNGPWNTLRNQVKEFSENPDGNFTNIILFINLRHVASIMERAASRLLEKIKSAQLNNSFPLNTRVLDEIMTEFNITMSDFHKSATIKVGKLNNKTLAFDYKIPKIDSQPFNIYRLTPIPKVHRNGTIEILDTGAPYLAVNNMRDRYFGLHDLKNCLELENNTFICKPPIIYKIKNAEDLPCGVAAVLNQSSSTCTSHLVVRQSLLTALLAPNSWMVTVTKEAPLLGLCSADNYENELKINSSGILRIRGDCTIRLGTSVVLRGERRDWRDSNLEYASLQTKTETAMNVDLFQSHVDQVIRDSIKKLKEEQIQPGTIYYPYVIGAGVLLTILLFMALLYRHLRPHPRNDGLNGAFQKLRVDFRTRSGKADTNTE